MADPLVAAAIYAETRGMISFSSCDGSSRWWAGARMCIRQARADLDTQAMQIRAQRLFAELAVDNIDTSQVRTDAHDLVRQICQRLQPWVVQGSGQSDLLDLVARWYILNAPERLRQLGVRFDQG